MIIRLLPDQIPTCWEQIKFAVAKVNVITKPEHMQRYCNALLTNLLVGKAQCWIVKNDETHKIQGILLTRIIYDAGDMAQLLLDCVYGYEPVSEDDKKSYFEHMKKFAESIGCFNIVAWTTNGLAKNAMRKAGFTYLADFFAYELKGGQNG